LNVLPYVYAETQMPRLCEHLRAKGYVSSYDVQSRIPLAQLQIVRGQESVIAIHHASQRFWRELWNRNVR